MTTHSLSTIAQLLCQNDQPPNFARLVGDLDAVLERIQNLSRKISWDCEDVATFDLPGTRILLAWTDHPGQGLSGILTLSVGPSPMPGPGSMPPDHNALCSRLAERIQARVSALAILWHQIDCQMTPEWVDRLVDTLPDLPDLLAPAPTLPVPRDETPITALRGLLPNSSNVANTLPDLPRSRDPELARLRAALYDEDPAPQSAPIRLAVHAMNATLIMVWLPLGAAALAQGILRGEDMRLASRLMVLTGTVTALAQSSLGQNLLDLAGA